MPLIIRRRRAGRAGTRSDRKPRRLRIWPESAPEVSSDYRRRIHQSDPVDGSVTERQGIRARAGGRLAYCLPAIRTGTEGATLRVYLERFDPTRLAIRLHRMRFWRRSPRRRRARRYSRYNWTEPARCRGLSVNLVGRGDHRPPRR